MRLCPACGNRYEDDARFCPMDATPLPPPEAVAAPPAPATGPGPAPQGPADQAIATDVDRGVVIAGRFQLDREFLDTPSGRLHRARDLRDPARPEVLVKIAPKAAVPSPMLADRALRELRQLARVQSPRVMRVLAHGRVATGDGELFVVFAPPPAGSQLLDEWVQERGLPPPDRARQIVLQIGEALVEAHQVGVVHRNVAPHTVYVAPGGEVLVIDFALTEVHEVRGRLVQGSPHYLSPEQAEGKSVDQRSSIYSLGAIYYYLLTGQPPVSGGSVAEVLNQVTLPTVTPQPPSFLRPGLPAEADRLLARALEKTGARRHLTLRQFLNEVDELGSIAPGAGAPAEIKPYRSPTRTMILGTGGASAPAVAAPVSGMPSAPVPAPAPPPDEVAAPANPRQARTLIGLQQAPPPRSSVSPQAVGAAFSGSFEKIAVEAPAVAPPVTAPPAEEADSEDNGATIPMPRMNEEELMATFGLSVPLSRAADKAEAAPDEEPVRDTVRGSMADLPIAPEAPPAPPASMPAVSDLPTEPRAEAVTAPPAKKGFRETAWFKRGEMEEYLEGQARPSQEVVLTPEDQARLSLRRSDEPTGSRGRKTAKVGPRGTPMTEAEMIAEMRDRNRPVIAAIVVAVVLVLAGLAYTLMHY